MKLNGILGDVEPEDYRDDPVAGSSGDPDEKYCNFDRNSSDDGESRFVDLTRENPNVLPIVEIKHGYLSVSDLPSQLWCERKLLYKIRFRGSAEDEPDYVKIGHELHRDRGKILIKIFSR